MCDSQKKKPKGDKAMKGRKFGIEMELVSKEPVQNLLSALEGILPGRVNPRVYCGPEPVDFTHKWAVKTDGSLCGSHEYPYTAEVCSPPLGIHELRELRKVLEGLKGILSANTSCGLHIHVSVADFKHVVNTRIIWKKFERTIVQVFSMSRRDNNNYCRLLRNEEISHTRLSAHRYFIVNDHAYWKFGTVEFRGHQGTANYHKIKHWVLFCNAMVEKATSYETPRICQSCIDAYVGTNVFEFIGFNGKGRNYMIGRARHFARGRDTRLDHIYQAA